MPLIPIDDLDDPRLAVYRHLKASNETRGLPLFVVEGEKLVLSLRDSRYPIESVLLSDRHAERIAPTLPREVTTFVVEHARISSLVGYNFHQGALAAGRRLAPVDPGSLVETRAGKVTLVACPVVQNPENLGTIVRTADVFGVDAVLVGPTCPDPLSRRVLRVSMGTVLGLPVIPCDDLAGRLDRLRSDLGLRLVATVTDPDAPPIDRFERPDRLAIVMGSEAHGLDRAWVDRCDHWVTIPMRPGAESLNVAVAAGIFLHRLAAPRR